MGALVLGVLIGWLIAWVYYTFWVKAHNDGEREALKAELELKNKQISSLQTQMTSSSQNTSTDETQSKSKTKSSVALKSADSGTSISKASVNKNTKKAASTSKKTTSTTKAPANKVKAAVPKTKASTTKPKSTKTTAANKKVPAKTKAKSVSKPKSQARGKSAGDDFTKLSGIGPSMSATLKSLGINSFEKLAATDDDKLRDMLEKSGARMNNNKDVMDSWNEQATVAAKGDFAALKKMQDALKK